MIFKALYIHLFFCVGALQLNAQNIESYGLPSSLDEISGLEIINDSLLVGLNDGGNSPKIYLLNFNGELLKKVEITNAKNKDWEDITTDGTNIYIGDVGNNSNKRKYLRIYKVKIKDLLNKREVKAEEIIFNYGEQKSFPPTNDSLLYDAEGITFYNDSIWIFSKNRAANNNGYSCIYKLSVTPGKYTVYKSDSVFIGTNGWLTDGITAVDVYDNHFYLLTYNRYFVKSFKDGLFEDVSEFKFDDFTQRESIVVQNSKSLFIADEKNPLVGDVKLYKITTKSD